MEQNETNDSASVAPAVVSCLNCKHAPRFPLDPLKMRCFHDLKAFTHPFCIEARSPIGFCSKGEHFVERPASSVSPSWIPDKKPAPTVASPPVAPLRDAPYPRPIWNNMYRRPDPEPVLFTPFETLLISGIIALLVGLLVYGHYRI